MDTDWITEGAQVAIYTYSQPASAALDTVVRITATQIVLAGGRKFRRDTLRPVGDSTRNAWAPSSMLCPPCDARVRDALAVRCLAYVTAEVDGARRSHNGTEASIVATLDRIDRAAVKARAAIADLPESPAGEAR